MQRNNTRSDLVCQRILQAGGKILEDGKKYSEKMQLFYAGDIGSDCRDTAGLFIRRGNRNKLDIPRHRIF